MSTRCDLLLLMRKTLIPDAQAELRELQIDPSTKVIQALVVPGCDLSIKNLEEIYEAILTNYSMSGSGTLALLHLVAAWYINNVCHMPSYSRLEAQKAYEFLELLCQRPDFNPRQTVLDLFEQAVYGLMNTTDLDELLWWLTKANTLESQSVPIPDNFKCMASIKIQALAWAELSTSNPEPLRQILRVLNIAKQLAGEYLDIDSLGNMVGDMLADYISSKQDLVEQDEHLRTILTELTEYEFRAVDLRERIKALDQQIKSITGLHKTVINLSGGFGNSSSEYQLSPDALYSISNIHDKSELEPLGQLHYANAGKFRINVWKALIKASGERVAVKSYYSQNEQVLNTFYTEVKYLEELSHSGIQFLQFFGSFSDQVDEDGEIWYGLHIVMELCQRSLGQELEARRESGAGFTPEEFVEAVQQLIEGFAILERKKIFHQDIKPDNIFLQSVNGHQIYKIADFNVSKSADPALNTAMSVDSRITGTDGYFSPELQQAWNDHRSGSGPSSLRYAPSKSDVFSLGLTLFSMASLERINGMNLRMNQDVLHRKIDQLPPHVPKELLHRMLQFDPRTRPLFQDLLVLLPRKATVRP